MESDLSGRLSTAYFKNVLVAINADKTVGPFAKGTGDIVQWCSLVCLLCICDLKEQHKNGTLKSIDDLSLNNDYKFPKAKAIQALADMVDKYFSTYFADQDMPSILIENILLSRYLIRMELIHQWGGIGPRIHKRSKVRNPKQRVRDALANGIPVEKISETAGISRATVYRMLKDKN